MPARHLPPDAVLPTVARRRRSGRTGHLSTQGRAAAARRFRLPLFSGAGTSTAQQREQAIAKDQQVRRTGSDAAHGLSLSRVVNAGDADQLLEAGLRSSGAQKRPRVALFEPSPLAVQARSRREQEAQVEQDEVQVIE
jgi:hypothetical protein